MGPHHLLEKGEIYQQGIPVPDRIAQPLRVLLQRPLYRDLADGLLLQGRHTGTVILSICSLTRPQGLLGLLGCTPKGQGVDWQALAAG